MGLRASPFLAPAISVAAIAPPRFLKIVSALAAIEKPGTVTPPKSFD